MAARVVALRITASAPLRRAVANALWIFSGEPSVAIVCDVHPRWLAASLTMLPCSWHCAAPQLMNTSFLPVGIGFWIGVETVMLDGRAALCSRTFWAWLSDALTLAFAGVELELELLPDEPQPATAPAATTAVTAATTALRRDRRTTGVRVDMGAESSLVGVTGGKYWWSGRGTAQPRPCEPAAAGCLASLKAGDGERCDQDDADEHVRRPLRSVRQGETGRPGAQQQHRDDRAPRVEAPVLELRRTEERGRERRQQVGVAGRRRTGLQRRREHYAR